MQKKVFQNKNQNYEFNQENAENTKSKKIDNESKKIDIKIKVLNLNKIFSNFFIVFLILILFLPWLSSFIDKNKDNIITTSQMVEDIREKKIAKAQVAGNEIRLEYKDSEKKLSQKEDNQTFVEILQSANIDLAEIDLSIENLSASRLFWELVVNLLPVILIFIFFIFMFKQAKGTQDGILGIGKSKAKLFIKGKQSIKFSDVGGMDEAKKELQEIVDFLKNPKKYTKVGARTPKGVLLIGPAGTGKTLLARAVAGEAGVQFLSIAGSEFIEMLVGVGASRARDLFGAAKKLAPSIVFIDEIDAIGRMRGNGGMSSHDEREQTLNQILVEMDGFTQNDNVIIMAATNRGDMLDPALIRPGRFDRRVMVSLPDLEERKFILKIHAKKKPFIKDLNWELIAKSTVGFSGADLENMLNEAAISIARDNRIEITLADIQDASLKVKLGPSKRRLNNDYERKITAYHEAGHAVISHIMPHADKVSRISIISRGNVLGYTLTPPERDKLQTTKSELLEEICVLLGGRAAELMMFNEMTAGASSDIERATRVARAMVEDLGMSNLGPICYSPQYEMSDYSKVYFEPKKISDRLQEKVDLEVQAIIEKQYRLTQEKLEEYKTQLVKVAERLLVLETLEAEEFEKTIGLSKPVNEN